MAEETELNFIDWLVSTGRNSNFSNTKTVFSNEVDLARQIYESEAARNAVRAYFEQLQPLSICDAVESNKLRNKGNIFYKEHHELEKAAFLYTKAIYTAPTGSQSLAHAHADRAVVLYELHSYEEAYEDCTCAVEFNIPSVHDVLSLQSKIVLKLKDCKKIQDCIKRFHDFNIIVPRFLQDFHEKLKESKSLTEESEESIMLKLPKFNKIRLSRCPVRGRFYIADEPIEAGEVILQDNAAIVAKFYPFLKTFLSTETELVFSCDNCTEDDIVPFPCYTCRSVFYCSKKCREEHFHIHRFECEGYQIQLIDNNSKYQMKLRFLLATFDDILRKLEHMSKGTVIHTAEELWPILLQTAKDGELLGLYSNFEKIQEGDECYLYALLALLFSSYLANQTDFFERTHCERLTLMPSEAEWHVVAIGLLLRFSSTAKLNALSVNKLTAAKPFAAQTVSMKGLYSSISFGSLFTGIYPWFCFFNHSCDGNTTLKMSNLKVSVYSTKHIAKGEEVTFDYILESARLNRDKRKEQLAVYMNCDCKRCTNKEDPILVKYMGAPCSCGGFCLIHTANPFCTKCGKLSNLEVYTFEEMEPIPNGPDTFIYFYGRWKILKKALGDTGNGVLSQDAEAVLKIYLQSTNAQILDNYVVNGLMVKLAVDLLEVSNNVCVPPLKRALYAAMLLDLVAIRKRKGFPRLDFDYKTIVEGAIWVVSEKPRKMFEEFYKLHCL